MAIWVFAVVRVALRQCFSPGGMQTTSSSRIPRSDLPSAVLGHRPQPAVTIKVVMCYTQRDLSIQKLGAEGKNAKAICSRVRVWRGRPYDHCNLRLRRQTDSAGGERPFAANLLPGSPGIRPGLRPAEFARIRGGQGTGAPARPKTGRLPDLFGRQYCET